MVDFAAPPVRPDTGQSTDFAYVVRPRNGAAPAALYQIPVQQGVATPTPVGTTPGTVAAGDDARIVGAATAASVTSLSATITLHTATLATKGQANGLAPLDAAGKVPAANLPAQTGGTATPRIITPYTAAGIIAATDDRADVNVPDGTAMFLAAPTVEGHKLTVKRRGAGGFTLKGNFDDVPDVMLTTGSGSAVNGTSVKDVMNFESTMLPAPTWLVIS